MLAASGPALEFRIARTQISHQLVSPSAASALALIITANYFPAFFNGISQEQVCGWFGKCYSFCSLPRIARIC